ncbi:hypothetical protein MAL04_20195 (plasmid) [Leptospira noguchii]|nr:hypothetical protein MAL04_20195 [Leptospira noguchii]
MRGLKTDGLASPAACQSEISASPRSRGSLIWDVTAMRMTSGLCCW